MILNRAKKITNRGKEISNRGRDYKSGQERLQIGTGITNRCITLLISQLNVKNHFSAR